MKYSIIIPAYNIEAHLEKALGSAYSQTLEPDEIIIVDDGSTDNTSKIAKQFPVKYVYQKNAGAAVARNRAVQEASGEWIIFLDGDDELLPDRIQRLEELLLTQDPKVVMVAGDEFEGNNDTGWELKELHTYFDASKPLFPQLFKNCFLSTSSMAVKREAFLAVGGMDPALRSAQDYDLWLRLAELGDLSFINKPISKYTLRPNTISSDPLKRYVCLKSIFRKHMHKVSLKLALERYLRIHYEAFRTCLTSRNYMVIWKLGILFFDLYDKISTHSEKRHESIK